MKILSKKNLYIIFQIITIILSLLIGNIISYLNISMYLTLLLLILLYSNNKNYKNDKITSIFSCVFSLFFTFGNIKGIQNFENYNLPTFIYYIVSFIGYYYLIKNILLFIYEKIKDIDITDNKKKEISKTKFILITTIIGFILYIPYLLNYFPGITSFDTYSQLDQILGNNPYSNHHPIMHTLIIKIFFDIGYTIFKNKNIGMLFFTIFQMLFVSFTFANVIYTCYKNKVNKLFLIVLFIFYYLVPYNSIYSVTAYKDVLFSCMVLLFILFLYNNKDNELTIIKKIELVILSIFICLLRTNGILAIILLIIILLIKYLKKYKNFILCISIGLVFSLIFKFTIVNILNVMEVESVEAFSIPLQNISYVIKNNGNISDKEYKILNKIMDTQRVKDVYDEDFSDPIKNLTREKGSNYLNENKIDFIKLWFSIGIKNINMYIKSYAYQTSGYWYHNYGVNTFATYDNYDNLGIVHKNYNISIVSKLLDILMYINRAVQHCLWSNALSIYIVIYSLYHLLKKNNYKIYIYPIIFIWLTLLIATPVGYEFRYQYSVFISFPFILSTLFIKGVKNYER